jgi:amino acid adenylation domain-containing protein
MQDATLPVAPDADALVRLGDGGPLGPDAARPAHVRFHATARSQPDSPALACGSVQLTYAELAAAASEQADRLRDAGVGPEAVVGICLPRDVSAVVAVLAVLEAGGAYLPLDPGHPVDRRLFMLRDAGAVALIASDGLAAELTASGVQVVAPVDRPANPDAFGGPAPEPALDHLAYVLYTSGSTGKPKGVMVEHRSLAAFVDWGVRSFSPSELESVLASTSLGFDISIFELLVPLASGGRIVLVDTIFALDEAIHSGVTLVNTVPSPFAAYLNTRDLPSSVRTVVLAGEPLPTELVERVHRQLGVQRVVNAYGPTEDTIYSTACEVHPGDRPPIGRPLPGSRAYVVDADLKLVARGEPGELCLAGAGLARGYRGRDDLTRAQFVPDPLDGAAAARMYRTGDLARWRSDGSLEHLGRIDHQIKLRGVRIEPAEIESALLREPGVGQAVVVPQRRDGTDDAQLVAYLVPSPGAQIASGRVLRDSLGRTLPDPLVPSVFVTLDGLPLNTNGKLDRERLPDLSARSTGTGSLTSTERQVAEIWTEILVLDGLPGPDDDFFELGGHSLLSFRLFDEIAKRLDCELPPNVLVGSSTLAELSARVDAGPAEHSRIVHVSGNSGHKPLTYVHGSQGGVFTLRRMEPSLGADQPFYGLQALAPRQRANGRLPTVAEMATDCLTMLQRTQPTGPYLLAGHSIGGHVAYEMACRLQEAGQQTALLALLDAAAPHTQRWRGRANAIAREFSGRGPEPRRPDLMKAAGKAARRMIPLSRGRAVTAHPVDSPRREPASHDMRELAAMERRYRPAARFRGDVVLYRTADTARFTGSATLGWDRYVEGHIEVVPVSGDHTSMLLRGNIEALGDDLSKRISALQRSMR